jgi:hypothetical protein
VGVVHRIEGVESWIRWATTDLSHLWTHIGTVEADIRKGLQSDLVALRKEVDHLVASAVGGVVGDVRTLEKDMAHLKATVASMVGTDVHALEAEIGGLGHRVGRLESEITVQVLRDLPDLARLVENLAKAGLGINDLVAAVQNVHALERELAQLGKGELSKVAGEVSSLERELANLPKLTAKDLANLGQLGNLLTWILPLISVGAVTTALVDAWKLMRDGECPCSGLNLPSLNADLLDGVVADIIAKDGI